LSKVASCARSSALLTGNQKSNDIDVHKGYPFKIQFNHSPITFQLHSKLVLVFRLQATAQADDRLLPSEILSISISSAILAALNEK